MDGSTLYTDLNLGFSHNGNYGYHKRNYREEVGAMGERENKFVRMFDILIWEMVI